MVRVSKKWLLKFVKSVGTKNVYLGDNNKGATLEEFREYIRNIKLPRSFKMSYNWSSSQKSHFEWGRDKEQVRVYIFEKIKGCDEPVCIKSFDVRNYIE